MTPLGKLSFHEPLKNIKIPRSTDTIHVHLGKNRIGSLYMITCYPDIWFVLQGNLPSLLVIHGGSLGSIKPGFQVLGKGKAIWRIQEAFDLLEKTRKPVQFRKSQNGNFHDVIYRGLKIGKILRTSCSKHGTCTLGQAELYPSYYTRTTSCDRYYWTLDPDLCKFLDIPYFNQKQDLRLFLLRSFICMRLYTLDQKIARTAQEIRLCAKELPSVINSLILEEKNRRTAYFNRMDTP